MKLDFSSGPGLRVVSSSTTLSPSMEPTRREGMRREGKGREGKKEGRKEGKKRKK